MAENRELLHRLGLKQAQALPLADPVGPDDEDEAEGKCFGYLRGVRDRATNLELMRIEEGDTVSFPYSWLGPSRFCPSKGIMLLFSGGELFGVRIRGRNLNAMLDEGMSLYDRGIMRHRVTFISEMSSAEARNVRTGQCVVERIEIMAVLAEDALKFLGL